MTVTSNAAALATVICESATIIASALAEVPRAEALHFTYMPRGVIVTALSPERLADAKPYLDAAFTTHLWGITTGYGPGGWTEHNRLYYQAPTSCSRPPPAQ